MEPRQNPALSDALKAYGQVKLADALNVSKQTVNDWKRVGRVPAPYAVRAEKALGVHRTVLCPEFDWGTEPEAA